MDILVSVLMTVYNHERYLKKAIDGVLMQKVDFTYELIIGEDCSTDRSRDIVKEYQTKYPKIIRAFFNPVNFGMVKNGMQVTKAARGKYIATCEGDDYWTDPHKLQLQIDFLEQHKEYSACYHSVQFVDENDDPLDIPTSDTFDEDSDVDKKLWPTFTLPGQTGSRVIRNVFQIISPELMDAFANCACNGDMKIPILMLCYGKMRRIGRTMSCYRRTYTGDSYNARMKGKDARFIYYFQYLERDKFASLAWGEPYFPHYGCLDFLEGILDDVQKGEATAREKLSKMAAYDIFQFFAFLVVLDIRRMRQSKNIFLLTAEELKPVEQGYVIFGTGDYGERCYGFLLKINGVIAEVWDNDKHKTDFHGVSIRSPHENVYGKRIILATDRYTDEMTEQLVSLGYRDDTDFIAYDKFMKNIYFSALGRKYPLLFSVNGKIKE